MAGNWTTVTESQYPWERDALDFVRQAFPAHEPYRAWSNFEFIADDGSINEVDLLLYTPQGFFLVEIKSRQGRLYSDAGTWTWDTDGRLTATDNPLLSANLKAKKLRALLERQRACQRKGRLPFLDALVFCSAPDLRCDLAGNARHRICLRDRPAQGETPARPGILAAVLRRDCSGLEPAPRGTHDSPLARTLGQAIDQAGIRPSQRHRKVSDYVLEKLIGEGPGYQDWQATHVQVPESKRRVRLYLVRCGASAEERQTIERAALREFKLLESLQHSSILRAHGFTEHEVGPALIFDHDPLAVRLDHFLAQRQDTLGIDLRLNLLRQAAEVIQYAHEKKIVHRGLCPQSILVSGAAGAGRLEQLRIKVFNWQVGYRESKSSSDVANAVSATSHVDWLIEGVSTAYLAPEALSGTSTGEHLDVFSLGALAFHICSGVPPADNAVELANKLHETKGLAISSVLNGAVGALQHLVQYSTHPEVSHRIDSVADFRACLDDVENELTAPDRDNVKDPEQAQRGDLLPGGWRVERRLGQGSCSTALLVHRDGVDLVLKVASAPEHNPRLKDEADILSKLRHEYIVDFVESLDVGDRAAFLMRPVFAERDKKLIETLGQRLRREGRLHVDLLQRFGEDLLDVVNYLEEQGIPHRDIKPDNIAVGMVGRGDKLHLVLFDFSLSRAAADNVRAGTRGYLDPLLPLRQRPAGQHARWDLHAERYAAAATLYELATGALPKWGDGVTNPSHLPPTTEVTLDAEMFDAALRDGLVRFFAKAFRHDLSARFDNGEEMLRAWRDSFEGIEKPGALSDHSDDSHLQELLSQATFDTPLAQLGLGTRATQALDRANLATVGDLLVARRRRLLRLRGVGNQTRREIALAVTVLRERLGQPTRPPADDEGDAELVPPILDAGNLGIDLIAGRLLKMTGRKPEPDRPLLEALLGLDPALNAPWPSQADVARAGKVSLSDLSQAVGRARRRWAKDPPLKQLRSDLVQIVAGQGGVMSIAEIAACLLVARGSAEDEPLRTRQAWAVLRAAVEVERTFDCPRFLVRRDSVCLLLAQSAVLATYAAGLGELADILAAEDPLVPPARVLEQLREIPAPQGADFSDARLLRLATAAARHAEVSSKQELYPRGMPSLRALKLAGGAIAGVPQLTVEELRERVFSRYPSAAPLPDRPVLDNLLREAGFEFTWNPAAKRGAGCYEGRHCNPLGVSSKSDSIPRLATSVETTPAGEVTPEQADARQFEERLERAVREGSFLSLLVNPRDHDQAKEELCARFPLQLIDMEGLFLDALRDVAERAGVNWDLVLTTDATPANGDWQKLLLLVGRAMPKVEQALLAANQTILLIYPGLLARYEQLGLLGRLAQKVGREDGIPGLWLLLPGDQQALLDGKPVPLLGPGQKARIPESWIKNAHGAAGLRSSGRGA